ncbi:MAG: sulfotransferase [Candidatus Kapaibacterium sp.]
MRKFVFIVGPSGSGTTLLTRLISKQKDTICLGGNFKTESNNKRFNELVYSFIEANRISWNKKTNFKAHEDMIVEQKALIEEILNIDEYKDTKRIVFKRSAPFMTGDDHTPDLFDLKKIFKNLKIIVMLRDPRASTYSSYRRNFGDNLRHCAKIANFELVNLKTQLSVLNSNDYIVCNYERLCSNPEFELEKINIFLSLPKENMLKVEDIKKSQLDLWKKELNQDDIKYLDNYFSIDRMKQFEELFK